MTRDKFENASQVALDKDARIMRLANMTEDLQARVALQDKEIRTLGNAGVNLLDRAEAAEAKVAAARNAALEEAAIVAATWEGLTAEQIAQAIRALKEG